MQGFEVELDRWNQSVAKLAEVSNKEASELLLDRSKKLLGGIIYHTPYKTGWGKGSWKTAKDAIGLTKSVGRRPNGQGSAEVSLSGDHKSITMSTNVKYLYIQNYGYDVKRKDGTVTHVTKHIGWFDAAIREKADWNMDKFAKECQKRWG